MTANIKLLHSCSFCGKNQTQVKTLVSGNGAYICNECVHLCMEVIAPPDTKTVTNSSSSLTPPQIVDYLNNYVIGQDLAKRTLSVAVYNHLKRLANPEVRGVRLDKSNIIMIGRSGVGKTHIVTTLARILEVPFAVVDATSLSQTGYVGLDPEECLVRLYQNAEHDISRAQKGIVFIDEIDKIGRKSGENVSTTRDVSGEGVQQALLKIIEGSDVKFSAAGGRKTPNGDFVTMNTSNILFILGGAFEGLDQIIAARTQQHSSMGFMGEVHDPQQSSSFELVSQVTTEDLISYGMIPELVGRIPVVLPLQDLDVTTLVRILTEPRHAIVRQFEVMFELEGIQLKFEPEALTAIAQSVITSRTGARGLRRVVESILLDTQYHIHELKQSGVHTVIVNEACVTHDQPPQKLVDAT